MNNLSISNHFDGKHHDLGSKLAARSKHWLRIGAACLGFLASAGIVHSATTTIQPLTEATSKDTKIYSGVPTSNFSSNLSVVSQDVGAHFLSLVQFDLSTLVAPATDITSATFRLYSTGLGASGGPVTGGTVTVSPILSDWKENDADAGSAPLATYNAFFGATPTITFGSAAASQNVTGAGFVDWDITNLVKSWKNGSQSNFGVLIQLSTNGGDVGFADTDSNPEVAGSAPSLTVNSVPEPATATITLGCMAIGLLRRRRAGASQQTT